MLIVMLSTTNSPFDKSNCRNDNRIRNNQNLRNGDDIISKPIEGIDSILSLDDTILRDIEDNVDSETSIENIEIHEKTLNSFADEWSICETFDQCKDNEPQIQDRVVAQGENEEKSHSPIFCNVTQGADNQWQDNTFLNEAFAQLKSVNDNSNAPKLSQDVAKGAECTDHRDAVYLLEQSSTIMNEILEVDQLENISELKRNSDLPISNVIPNKKHCLSNVKAKCSNTCNKGVMNNYTFHGLPNTVKSLILKVRSISALYKWQDECLSLPAVSNRKNLIYALPTSGGKTLVAEILMLKELICNKKNAIFILPFVAIVQEKVQSMAPFALELGFFIEEYAGAKGIYPPKKRRKKNSVYICTIEKALGLINSLIEENRLHEIGMIVVDELHLLGESGGRGATLEGLLTKVLYMNKGIHIIGMSATIGNLSEIAEFLDADLYTGNFRPIEINEYVKCEDNIWLVDSRTEELLTDLKKINYRYSNDAATIDPDRIGGLVMDVVPNDSCLIFCSSRKNCENVALLLSNVLFKSLEKWKTQEKEKLLNALKTEEGLCPILRKTIRFGVAYHHSGLTAEERRLLEDAFRAGILCVICCTSTLAAGVNLPARRVILRSPYVGNQFLNISRYKQMIGRAGRAGLGNIGESILICKKNELPKVKGLLTSKMDDSLSTMHIEKDRGINNLILSATLLTIASTRSELHKIAQRTLLSIQQKRLDVHVKKVTDDAITEFLKSGVIKVKEEKMFDPLNLNTTIVFPSQGIDIKETSTEVKGKKTILVTSETELELCALGRAAMKGSIEMSSAFTLYQDLKIAQRHLVLLDYLHLLYLVTPYDLATQIKPVGSIYYDVVTKLSETQMQTARLLGVTEVNAIKLRDGLMPKNVEPRVIQRFYVTLILYELWNHHAVYTVAEKFQVSRGIIQNLLTAVSAFASSVVRFCQELNEFWAFTDLLSSFSKKLSYCCPLELEALMELPLVKIGRARQLYNAGYRTIQCIAKAKPEDLQDKIPYLNKRAVIQITEAAKLLILGRIEDLKEEAEDVLDGIDLTYLVKSNVSAFSNSFS